MSPTQHDSEHLVEFYETQEFLAQTVTGFVGAALKDGNAAIVLAITAHREAIDASLRASQIDLAAAAAADRYVSFDATALLAGFMTGGAPGAALFSQTIGRAIARAGAGGRSVRIFDEVVALLWDRADITSAVTLENLWDELATVHEFELLCAYPMRVFENSANAEAFQRIRAQHANLAGGSATRGVQPRDPADQLALSDHAELVGGIGSWDWTPHTGELRWSDNLFRIVGLEPGSVTPSPALVLSLVHPADIGRAREVLGVLRAGGGMRMLECRIVRHDDVVVDLRVTMALSMGDGEQEHFVGCVQDVTAERRGARTLAAHVAVATALDEWETFERGAIHALVITPAMVRIGELWASRAIGVADEHLASSISQRALIRLLTTLSSGRDRARSRERVLLAAVEGQHHILGLRMIADVLEGAGFDVVYLGEDVPVDSLLESVMLHRPAVVGLGFGIASDVSTLADSIWAIHDAAPATRMMLGGRAVPLGLRTAGYPYVASSLEVVGLVEQILAAPAQSLPAVIEPLRSHGPGLARMREPAVETDAIAAQLARSADEAIDVAREHVRRGLTFRDMAFRDPLTDLANRRGFDEELSELTQQTRSGGTVLMIDVDAFKLVNDGLGHAVGDLVLRAIGHAISDSIRPGDLAARIGGDEFAVLLPGATPADACVVADRICAAVALCADPPVSISVGVAAVSSDARGALLAADTALYGAKRAGRDRILTAPAQSTQPVQGAI